MDLIFDLEWLYDIYILEIWHIFSIIFAVAFIVYLFLHAKKSKHLVYFLVLQSILLVWLVAKVFKTIAPTVELKWIFIVVQYLAVCFLGSSFLIFSYFYARGKPLSRRIMIFLNVPPVIFFFAILTNNRHHLFYSTYDFLGDTFGPLFYGHTAIMYSYLALGIYFCATCFRQMREGKASASARLLAMGIIIPLIFNVLYIGGIMEPRFDITPVTCNISLILFAYAIYRYQFLDVIPAGISTAFNNLKEGVLVFDEKGYILDRNQALKDIPSFLWKENPSGVIDPKSHIWKYTYDLKDTNKEETLVEIIVPGDKKGYFTVSMFRLPTSSLAREEFICVFFDNTDYHELINDLEERNRWLALANKKLREYADYLKELAVMEEKNRMAREIHDILGHSLVLVLNLLENCIVLLKRDKKLVRHKLTQVASTALQGLEELKKAVKQNRSIEGKTSDELKKDISEIVKKYRLSGMNIEFIIKDPKKTLNNEYYHTVFRLCQEALTNSLKHGGASQVNIFIRNTPGEIEIFILDNGKGCNILEKGHGLTNMEERVKSLKGALSYGSPEGLGFTIHAWIPY